MRKTGSKCLLFFQKKDILKGQSRRMRVKCCRVGDARQTKAPKKRGLRCTAASVAKQKIFVVNHGPRAALRAVRFLASDLRAFGDKT